MIEGKKLFYLLFKNNYLSQFWMWRAAGLQQGVNNCLNFEDYIDMNQN